MKNTKIRGFSIIELVIVIAVIAILSAVVIPTLAGVVEDAQNTARDTKAKNAYTEFISLYPTEDNSYLFIKVNSDGTDYYYSVSDGQIDLENETDSHPVEPETGIECNGYVVYPASGLAYTDWSPVVLGEESFKEIFGAEMPDRVSYGYDLTPTSDDNRADVSVVIKVYVGGVCYNATAAGKVHAYTLPSGDTLWEGPIDGEIVIGESREKIIVGFTRIESSGESLLSLTVSDRNCVTSFGEDIIKGEVLDFFMEQDGIEG